MTREEVAAAFTASIAHLKPISDREGQYNSVPVRARTYVTDIEWPEAIASSVRAVVFRSRAVVVVRHWDGYRHIIPGGRRELGETIEQGIATSDELANEIDLLLREYAKSSLIDDGNANPGARGWRLTLHTDAKRNNRLSSGRREMGLRVQIHSAPHLSLRGFGR